MDALGNTVIIRLEPVYYISGLSMRLLSIGEWLQQGCTLRGTKLKMAIQRGSVINLSLYPKRPGDTIYWLTGTLIRGGASLVSMSTIFNIDYDLMHRRMGHPSKDVLSQVRRHTQKFPTGITFPKE